MDPTRSPSEDFDLQHWLTHPSLSSSETQDASEPEASTVGDNVWALELYDLANRGPFMSAPPAITVDSNVVNEILHIFRTTPIRELATAALSPHLNNHPCRVFTAFLRSLIYEAGAPGWGCLLAEMSHLVYQHTKSHPMGTTVPDTVFNRVREVAMTRLARTSFKPEEVIWDKLGEIQKKFHISWGSVEFCKHVHAHLDEVARTARESTCRKAKYFVCAELDHPGIVRSGLADNGKQTLLEELEISVKYGCKLLHTFKDGKVVVWFGNRDFAHLLQKSLYDISCPGWCGSLDEMNIPNEDKVTVCQMTEVPVYTVASQIAWLVYVTRYYLETELKRHTTCRPQKRRAGGVSQPTPNPWIEWTGGLDAEVNSDIRIIVEFLAGLLAPEAVGKEMDGAFEKIRSYTNFIARPNGIPHIGSLGSFMEADAPPLLIDDQSILTV